MREYLAGTARSPREDARIRQFRNENFVQWYIPEIIAFLPVLLQIALVLFFVGLLDLLWQLHAVVAGVVTGLVSIALLFLAVTTIMPAFRSDCPHKSPQAMGLIRVKNVFIRGLSWVAQKLYTYLGWNTRAGPFLMPITRRGVFRTGKLQSWMRSIINNKRHYTWKDLELEVVQLKASEGLESQFLAKADATLMEDSFLWKNVRACMRDLEDEAALKSLHEILVHRADGLTHGIPQWKQCNTVEMERRLIMLADFTIDVLSSIDPTSTDYSLVIKSLESLCRAIRFENGSHKAQALFLRIFNVLADLLHSDSDHSEAFRLMWTMYERSAAALPHRGGLFAMSC